MFARIAAIVFVFLATSAAWVVLGTTVAVRTSAQDSNNHRDVADLWGVPQRQKAPTVSYLLPPSPTPTPTPLQAVKPGSPPPPPPAQPSVIDVPLESSAVDVALALQYREKGTLWYSTYNVLFAGEYVVTNRTDAPHDYFVTFEFPAPGARYDNFHFTVGDKEMSDLGGAGSTITAKVPLAPGASEHVSIAYGSQGIDDWRYEFGSTVNQMKNLRVAVHTNFDDVFFPQGGMSPSKDDTRGAGEPGHDLVWEYTNLLSGQQISVAMPQRLNPGPWVAQITFFGPLSLFFFFFLLYMISTIQRVPIHPMNYFFIGTGFFAFHLLLTYLVDHVSIHVAFAICSAVSMFLVITYMRLVVGFRFAIFQVGISQFVYLVLFGYTFFFEKYTGLSITIMSIVTLFIVMQATGRIDWSKIGEPSPTDGPGEEPTVPPPSVSVA